MKVAGHRAVKAVVRFIAPIIVITSAPAPFMVRKHDFTSPGYAPLERSLVSLTEPQHLDLLSFQMSKAVVTLRWTAPRSAAALVTACLASHHVLCRATGYGPMAMAVTFWVWSRTTAPSANRSPTAGSCRAAWWHSCRSACRFSDNPALTRFSCLSSVWFQFQVIMTEKRKVKCFISVGDWRAASEESDR